ncbi:flagellar assembly protein FliX [Chelatococcus sp. SYSU_G07232]|uniref:Flagellar assembly protein FliX n=2 Tax=Chelatococcus albus TaxID=3047466 RepID=A0ABT7AGG6_9HYPH|nr:flagellar assembly protein FliX [Chelatococcus sp. SYSU_G07232]
MIMRVEARAMVGGGAAAVRRGSGHARFSLGQGAAVGRNTAAGAAQSVGGIDALIALQANEDPTARRRRHIRRGHDLLDGLDRLKAALLAGQVPIADLKRLTATLAARSGTSGDAQLDDLIAHIELRAHVELAKLQR